LDLVDNQEMVDFVQAAAARYSVPPYNVKHWEFYNEPDNGSEALCAAGWSCFGQDPAAYAALLADVYQPLKNVDAQAQVLLGGIAYDWWAPDGPFVPEFLDGVLAAGGGAHFDLMNFHYYPSFHATWDPDGPGIVGKATYLRAKLASYGVDKPLVCTEAGMWSSEAAGCDYMCGSDELQSRYVAQLLSRSKAADLSVTIWFKMVDNAGLESWQFGLLGADLNPKPSYAAYQTWVRQLAGADYVGGFDAGAAEIEAYEYLVPGDARHVIVAWTQDDLGHDLSLMAGTVEVVDKFGDATTIVDGEAGDRDGQSNGRVQIQVNGSPLYLHPRD
jgi:hypothetical protein